MECFVGKFPFGSQSAAATGVFGLRGVAILRIG